MIKKLDSVPDKLKRNDKSRRKLVEDDLRSAIEYGIRTFELVEYEVGKMTSVAGAAYEAAKFIQFGMIKEQLESMGYDTVVPVNFFDAIRKHRMFRVHSHFDKSTQKYSVYVEYFPEELEKSIAVVKAQIEQKR